MKHVNLLFCWAQIGLGIVLAAAILYGAITYGDTLQAALGQADRLLTSTETQLDVSIRVLNEVNTTLEQAGESIDTYQETLHSIEGSTTTLAQTAATWSTESHQIASIALGTARMMDAFQEELPIEVPQVDVGNRQVAFDVPTGLDIRQESTGFDYPASARVNVSEESVRYPRSASIQTCDRNVAGLNVEYPCGLDIATAQITFTVPSSIEIVSESFAFDVPRIQAPTFERVEFDVPDGVTVSYRELMTTEKDLLSATASDLITTAATIKITAHSLTEISELLAADGEVSHTLRQLSDDLARSQAAIVTITADEIPAFTAELQQQKKSLAQTKALFANVQVPLVPITAFFMLFPLLMILNGIVLLSMVSRS